MPGPQAGGPTRGEKVWALDTATRALWHELWLPLGQRNRVVGELGEEQTRRVMALLERMARDLERQRGGLRQLSRNAKP